MRHLVVGLIGLWGTGCAGGQRSPEGPRPDVTAELRSVAAAYVAASSAKDADHLVSFFAPTIVSMSPQAGRPLVGVDGNRAAWRRFFASQAPHHAMTTDTVVVSGSQDLGYTMGRWDVGVDTPNGRAEANGTYLAVWRRLSGEWKIVALSAFTHR